ncbi:MAG TPA: sn-glycerol-3-phosphate ABC transporter ATP-binding protein UgpC [Devosiaceae bacterium]
MAGLQLKDLRKDFGTVEVIKGVNLQIRDGEFTVFVGPSGCGKSTLLRMIAGLEHISGGELWIGDTLCNDVEPRDRGIAMVFQSYALYPHMTVHDNFGFSLKLARVPKAERDRKVREAAQVLQMEHLLDRKPAQLSGGQRQRVAIGRAIVRNPEVFLFDEPLSNLDAALRVDMRMELSKLHQQLGTTMIYVTHDQVEAMTLADRIVVLNGGIVQQIGTPLELYKRPANLFVAGFIGSPKMNFLDITAGASADGLTSLDSADLSGARVRIAETAVAPGTRGTLGIRPHDLRLSAQGAVAGEVQLVERLGNETVVNLRLSSGKHWLAVLEGDAEVGVGERIGLDFAPDKAMLFDTDGQCI